MDSLLDGELSSPSSFLFIDDRNTGKQRFQYGSSVQVVPAYVREAETSPPLSVLWNFTLPFALAGHLSGFPKRICCVSGHFISAP